MRKFFPLWQKPLLLFLLVFFLPLLCKLLHQNLYEQEKYPLIEDFFPFGENHFYFSYWYSSCICFANCCVKTFIFRKNIRSLRIFSPFGKNCFYFSYWCFFWVCFASCCVKTFMNRKSIHSLRIFSPLAKTTSTFPIGVFLHLLCKLLRQNLHEQEKYPLISASYPPALLPFLLQKIFIIHICVF